MYVGITHFYPVAKQKTYFVNFYFFNLRDISFLYDVKYVKGETRESAVCPPRADRALQSRDGVIVPHKVNKVFDNFLSLSLLKKKKSSEYKATSNSNGLHCLGFLIFSWHFLIFF